MVGRNGTHEVLYQLDLFCIVFIGNSKRFTESSQDNRCMGVYRRHKHR